MSALRSTYHELILANPRIH